MVMAEESDDEATPIFSELQKVPPVYLNDQEPKGKLGVVAVLEARY